MLLSLNRGLDIMKYLVLNRCASVSEISQVFHIDKSTASRVLSVLAEHDLVYKEESTMKYYPGIGTLLYSSRTISNYLILDEIHPFLCSLAEKISMTAQVCVLKNDRIFIIDQVKSKENRFLKEPALPGMTEPLHCSAIGKCILAYMPEEHIKKILDTSSFEKYTDTTITDKTALQQEIKQIRQDGYAKDFGELSPKVFCLAVPITDRERKVTFSLGVSGAKDFLVNERLFKYVLKETKNVAEQISRKYSAVDIL